jgi:hypothetical protein
MIELVSSMPAPQFGDRSSRMLGSELFLRFKRFLCFILIYVRYFRVPQVDDHWSTKYGNLESSQSSGRSQALTGIAIPLFLIFKPIIYMAFHISTNGMGASSKAEQ